MIWNYKRGPNRGLMNIVVFIKYITCFWTIKQGQLYSWKLLFHKLLLLFPKSRWSNSTSIVNLRVASVTRPVASHVLFPKLELGKRQDFPLVDFFVSFIFPFHTALSLEEGLQRTCSWVKGLSAVLGNPPLKA